MSGFRVVNLVGQRLFCMDCRQKLTKIVLEYIDTDFHWSRMSMGSILNLSISSIFARK